MPSASNPPARPRDLALLILASGELLPRQRARDQQADIAGLQLKRQILDRLAAIDPEPEEVEACLGQIVQELEPPTGPARAIARGFFEEWQAVQDSPEFLELLLEQAQKQTMPKREEPRRGPRMVS